MGVILITATGNFKPSDYGIKKGDVMQVICVGGGGGGGSAASTYSTNQPSYGGAGGEAGKCGKCSMNIGASYYLNFHASLAGGGGGGFGAGGGGGACYSPNEISASSSAVCCGGGGGNAGQLSVGVVPVTEDLVDSEIPVTIGAGGAGGAQVIADSISGYLNGKSGSSGGTTSFGSFISAKGGAGGYGGRQSNAAYQNSSLYYITTQPNSQTEAMALGGCGKVLKQPFRYGSMIDARESFILVSSGGGGAGGFVLGGYIGGNGGSGKGNCGGSGRFLPENTTKAYKNSSATSTRFESLPNNDSFVIRKKDLDESNGHGFGGRGASTISGSVGDASITSVYNLMSTNGIFPPEDGSNLGGRAGSGCVVVMW